MKKFFKKSFFRENCFQFCFVLFLFFWSFDFLLFWKIEKRSRRSVYFFHLVWNFSLFYNKNVLKRNMDFTFFCFLAKKKRNTKSFRLDNFFVSKIQKFKKRMWKKKHFKMTSQKYPPFLGPFNDGKFHFKYEKNV